MVANSLTESACSWRSERIRSPKFGRTEKSELVCDCDRRSARGTSKILAICLIVWRRGEVLPHSHLEIAALVT